MLDPRALRDTGGREAANGCLEQFRGGAGKMVALTRDLEAKPGQRGEGASLVAHRAGSKRLGLSTLTLGSAFLTAMTKAVHNKSLALQLGQSHFSADYLRSHVVVMNISICQILLHK